jgi:hypothetical protein
MGKRGPKSKAGNREDNGRLSRRQDDVTRRVLVGLDASEIDTLSVGLEARERVHGLPRATKDRKTGKEVAVSREPMAGSFVGRLCQQRVLSRDQYEAATTWLEDATNYTRVRRSPIQPNAIDLNATRGGVDNYENVSLTERITKRYHDAGKAVVDAQNAIGGLANLFGALDVCVRQDAECWHLVGDLRIVLNALAKFYGLERAAQAA